jgi:hypothetical protein
MELLATNREFVDSENGLADALDNARGKRRKFRELEQPIP